MKAVIPAAGIASRLRPLTNDTPKCLLHVGGRPILARTLDGLLANGIADIVFVTGYLDHMLKAYVAEHYPQLRPVFVHNPVFDSTNNIYSLWLAKEALAGDDMLLLDSDIVFDERIVGALVQSGYENCLALKRHAVGEEEIKVRLDGDQRIVEIGKEVVPAEAAGESIGLEVFRGQGVRELFAELDRQIVVEKQVNRFYEAAFQAIVDRGCALHAVDVTRYRCMEIDTAADLEHAARMLAE